MALISSGLNVLLALPSAMWAFKRYRLLAVRVEPHRTPLGQLRATLRIDVA